MSGRVTPAVLVLREAGVAHTVHEFDHPASERDAVGYGAQAARSLGLDAARVFKTLVVAIDDDQRRLGVVVAPVTGEVDLKAVGQALGGKRAALADRTRAERATGYVAGGVSPFGQRRPAPTVVDASATNFATIYVSGGRRGLELEVAPDDLITLLGAVVATITRR